MIDLTKINEIALRIASKFNPEQIILFGSYAKGTPDNGSDIDLLIVQDTNLPNHKRGLDIRLSLIGTKMPFDILVYTRNEFENEKNDKFSFLNSAMKNSKILYERTN
jgi:predicted nucleotidyltransferase